MALEPSHRVAEEFAMTGPSFPPELERFVEEQVAAGHFQSEQDLLVSAVRVLRDLQVRQREFYEDVRLGIEQLERGDVIEYDEAGLRGLFDELYKPIADGIEVARVVHSARDLGSLLRQE
jgi:Arc/MetJ-type ribon-helix-helix transcriptional regulator